MSLGSVKKPINPEKENKIKIHGRVHDDGLTISVHERHRKKSFKVVYPLPVWKGYPQTLKKILLDNLAFLGTCFLPFIARKPKTLEYNTAYPLIHSSIIKNLTYSLPFYAALRNGETVESLLRILLNSRYKFRSFVCRDGRRELKKFKSRPNRVLIPFTFGKDSLLTHALCRELNLKSRLIFVAESGSPFESRNKKILAKRFEKEFDQKVLFLNNNFDKLWEKGDDGWFGWEFQLTVINLLLLPYAFDFKARYILFANEKSCNDYAFDDKGIRFFPVFEQSRNWTRELSIVTENLTGGTIKVRTLLEPTDELLIVKTLHKLYPELAKYQMSCFAENRRSKTHRWCGRCSKCARMFIFLKAWGIDLKTVGFEDNLFDKKFKHLFSAFGGADDTTSAYDLSLVGRDEQLLAFLFASRLGNNGDLVKLFKRKLLKETLAREKELKRRYLSLRTTDLIPRRFRKRIVKIFEKGIAR